MLPGSCAVLFCPACPYRSLTLASYSSMHPVMLACRTCLESGRLWEYQHLQPTALGCPGHLQHGHAAVLGDSAADCQDAAESIWCLGMAHQEPGAYQGR